MADAQYKRGSLELADRELIYKEGVAQINELLKDAQTAENWANVDKLNAEKDKIVNNMVAMQVIRNKQASGEALTDADYAGARLSPPSDPNVKGDMTDSQVATYIGKQFLDTGMFSEFSGQETKRKMVNATMKIADNYSDGTRTQRATQAVQEMRQRVAQYHQLVKGKKYPLERVQNDFMSKYGFIPGDE